jgi:hypothetical protein
MYILDFIFKMFNSPSVNKDKSSKLTASAAKPPTTGRGSISGTPGRPPNLHSR